MFASSTLLSYLLLAVSVASVSAAPAPSNGRSLAFTTKIRAAGLMNIAETDRARAAAFRSRTGGHAGSKRQPAEASADLSIGNTGHPVVATNRGTYYSASVGIGSPPTEYRLLIDTGSANTWIGADKKYTPTHTSKRTWNTFNVSYGSGSVKGNVYTDRVTLSSDLVISKQTIGVATESKGFGAGIDGILGVGPVDLTEGTDSGKKTVPTVTDNLFSQGTIRRDVLGVFFAPYALSDSLGSLSFGGADSSHYIGEVSYVPITKTSPASTFWGINTAITYGLTSILHETAGIVDTGTSLVLIATNAFKKYVTATGGVLDNATGLLKITETQYERLKPLQFNIGGKIFELTKNAQIWPRSKNSEIGGEPGAIYLIVSDIGTNSGVGLDFIVGYAFLERFYSVYDTANKRVGLAYTEHTLSVVN